jgi:Conserved TM helix
MLGIDIQSGLSEAWERIITFVPKFLGFLTILLIGYFIAKLVARLVDQLLERVGFDGWVERGALKTALERSRFDGSDILSVVAFWTIFLITLQLAFGVFGPNPVSDLIEGIIAYLPNVFAAVVILVIVAALAKVVTDLLSAALGAVSGGEWIARGAGRRHSRDRHLRGPESAGDRAGDREWAVLCPSCRHRGRGDRRVRWWWHPDGSWLLGACQQPRRDEGVRDPAAGQSRGCSSTRQGGRRHPGARTGTTAATTGQYVGGSGSPGIGSHLRSEARPRRFSCVVNSLHTPDPGVHHRR